VSNKKILIVDDDLKLRQLLSDYLSQSKFDVVAVENGDEMKRTFKRQQFDLIILDLMLQTENGLDLLEWVKKQNNQQATLILSAKGNELDRITGLELGADDYLAKPFNPRELLARITNIIKRTSPTTNTKRLFSIDQWLFDENSQTVKNEHYQIDLTTAESKLLLLFCEHANKQLDRNFLMLNLKGYEHQVYDRAIDVGVKRLRAKLEADPNNPQWIKTVWGKGYVFSAKVEELKV